MLCAASLLFCTGVFPTVFEIDIRMDSPIKWDLFDHEMPDSFYIKTLTCASDEIPDLDELVNSIGIASDTQFLRTEFKRILTLLQKSQKCENVHLLFIQQQDGVFEVRMTATSWWNFLKVSFSGSLIGKERYRQYYLLEPYERFDEAKHKKSCLDIVKVLKEKGYKKAAIKDHIAYDFATKNVTVNLYLLQGIRFVIRKVAVYLEASCNEKKCFKLTQRLTNRLKDALHSMYYDYTLVQHEIQQIKQYLLYKGYPHVQIEVVEEEDNEGFIDLKVAIHCLHKKIEMNGNHFFSSEQLIASIAHFDQAIFLLPPLLIAEEIEKIYRKKGFWQVRIGWKEDKDSLVFSITEGTRITLKQIIIKGAQYRDECWLHEQFFNGIIQNCYDEELIKKCSERLIHFYRQEGFWDCVIAHEEYVAEHDNAYVLMLTMKEGEHRFLKALSIDNFPEVLQESYFLPFLYLKTPIIFPAKLIQEQRQFLVYWLHNKGFLYTIPQEELLYEDGGIIVRWHFAGLQEPILFGKTLVRKNTKLPLSLITRELCYNENELWNKAALDQTVSRLKALEIFDSVTLTAVDIFTPELHKNLLLTCCLDDPFEIKTRAGFQLVGRHFKFKTIVFKWGVSFLWKNPTYHADQIRCDVDVSRYMREVSCTYKWPWLWHLPLKGLFKLYSIRYEQPLLVGLRQILYQENKDGCLLSVQKEQTHYSQGFNVGFEWMGISRLSEQIAQRLNFEPRLVNQRIPYLYGESTFFFDYLDNKVQPMRGSLSVISAKAMFPLQKTHVFYVKILAEESFFVPLYQQFIFGFRVRFGHIFNRNFSAILPPERFYLGGAFSVRGYEQDRVPPLTVIECQGTEQLAPLGGKSMVNINTEIRFPLFKAIGGVVFFDGGTLNQDRCALIQPKNLNGSVGFGVRYNSPVGALRFDIGWKLRKAFESECSYAWFLTLGQAF